MHPLPVRARSHRSGYQGGIHGLRLAIPHPHDCITCLMHESHVFNTKLIPKFLYSPIRIIDRDNSHSQLTSAHVCIPLSNNRPEHQGKKHTPVCGPGPKCAT